MSGLSGVKLTKYEPISVWYELSAPNAKTLQIRVHDDAFKHICMKNYKRANEQFAYKLPEFIPPTEQQWGITGLIKRVAQQDAWHIFESTLPIIIDSKDRNREDEIHIQLRCSLSIFFNALWLFPMDSKETGEKQRQLLIIEHLSVRPEMHGASLSVTVTPELATWLSQAKVALKYPEIEDVMMGAYNTMWQHRKHKEYDRHSIRVHSRPPKNIYFNVPGDACDLSPECSLNEGEHGYWLVPHNVDNSMQQLTFLMGLAKFHDLARTQPSPH
jgi:hypothetical protein